MTDAAPTPDDLRQTLKERLRWLCSIFGQPSDLLRLLAVAEWRRLRVWVRGVEALAAQLVRALAATLPPLAETAPRPACAIRAGHVDPDTDYPDSDRWTGVRFRFRDDPAEAPTPHGPARPPAPGFAAHRGFPERSPQDFRSGRRLALRLEAVIRVAENAERYAKRLARRRARPPRRPAPPDPRAAGLPPPGPAPDPGLGPAPRPPIGPPPDAPPDAPPSTPILGTG